MKSNETATPTRAKRFDAIDFRMDVSLNCKLNLLQAFVLHILTVQSTDAVISATKTASKQSGIHHETWHIISVNKQPPSLPHPPLNPLFFFLDSINNTQQAAGHC